MKLIDLIRLLWNNIDHDELNSIIELNSMNNCMKTFMKKSMEKIIKDNISISRIVSITYGKDSIDIDTRTINTGGAYIRFVDIDLDINFYQDGCIVILINNDLYIGETKKIHIDKNYLNLDEEYDETILTLTCGRDINLTLEEIYNYE